MIATVIHFAFGCCLHASHFAGSDTCCTDEATHGHLDAGCDCDGHGHDHDSTDAATSCHDHESAASRCGAGIPTSRCGCDGCSCAATPFQIEHELGGFSAVEWLGGVIDAACASIACAHHGRRAGSYAPVASDLRPPLFERLLV